MTKLSEARKRLANRQKNLKALQKRIANTKATIKRLLAARKPLRLRALTIGREELGVMEHGGNNKGQRVEQIIRYANGQVPEAWCVDFVIWCYGKAGSKSVKPGFTRAVRFMLGSATRQTSRPKRGQMVRYTFDHTGLFITWCNWSGSPRPKFLASHVKALEGNTGAEGAVSDSATGGDGVYIKVRPRSFVRDFLRAVS